MAVGDTGDFAGSLQEVIVDSMTHFSKSNVCLPLVQIQSRPQADTVTFPVYNLGSDQITSADVGTHDEHDSNAITAVAVDSEKKTATLDMYSIRVPVHDETVLSSADNPSAIAGQLVGNALGAKADKLLVSLFDSFSNTSNDTTNGISIDDLFGALGTLQASNAPAPYNMVEMPSA